MTDSTIALIERLENPLFNEYNYLKLVMKEAATELTTLLQRLKSAEESAVEASIRAHAWMEAHDKLQAGKPYSFPSPADKPALLQRCEKLEQYREYENDTWRKAHAAILQRCEKAEAERDELERSLQGQCEATAAAWEQRDEAEAEVAVLTDPKYLESKLLQVGVVDSEWKDRAELAERQRDEAEARVAELEAKHG